MAKLFEIVIFTAGMDDYADWALGFLESSSLISHRLYRQHTILFQGSYIKDLERLGRDLDKTLIVDNLSENFKLQPQNGIHILTWISDSNDNCLEVLASLLEQLVA